MIIKDFRTDDCEISEEEVLNILKGIYDGTACNGCYIGGSLCYTHKVENHPRGKEDFILVFHVDDNFSKEIIYWISKLYIQNKTEKHCHWNEADRNIKNYEGRS